MKKEEIIEKVKHLNFPPNSFIVFGSCPMAAVGIREAGDIDLLVSGEVFESLETQGWKIVMKGPKDNPLTHDIFEAHPNWNFSSYNPTLEELLSRAMIIDEVPFASLDDVKKWKSASGRPKDLVDVELIEKYLASQN